MLTIINGEWIADFKNMVCLHIKNRIKVYFEKNGKTLIGKIRYIPYELTYQWDKIPNGNKFIQEIVTEAEKVFLKAYIEKGYDKKEIY